MRRLFVGCLLVFFTVSSAGAVALSQFFNESNFVIYHGTKIFIGNVVYGEKAYWGEWSLQGDLSFKLTSYGELNDQEFVNLKRVIMGRGGTEVEPAEVEGYGFDNLFGCRTFLKRSIARGFYLYYCETERTFRMLGMVTPDKSYRYLGFEFPRYLPPEVPYTVVVSYENTADSTKKGSFLFTIFFKKVDANGKTCWEEIWYDSKGLRERYSFDPATYAPCK